MFFKLKKVCQEKVSKSSKLSLVDQVFCVSRMKNALSAWTKGMIVIRSETAFLLSRWKIFCLAIRMRKTRHNMKRELLKANCVVVTKRAFTKWANDVRNALSYVLTAYNSHQRCGTLSSLSRAFYIWTEQRAHSIFVSVFMKWSQRARQRITWAIFLRMHAALLQRKLMLSVLLAWRKPAQASFMSITDAEVVAMYIVSHRHDSLRSNVLYGNRAFKAVCQQISDARNYTFVRASNMMETCPFESADKVCIQLTSTLWLQQIKAIISIKPSRNTGYTPSSNVPHLNLNDVYNACRDLLDPSFVDRILAQPRETFSKAKDALDCNWGACTLSAAARMSEHRQIPASLIWSDLVYLLSVTSNSCVHENSLRQHASKAEMTAVIKDVSDKTDLKSKQHGENFVSRCLRLTGMRMWLSSVVGGWNSMSTLVPLIRNVGAVWDLRLKERRALVLRDNLIIISGKVKDESSIFAALFKSKKAKTKLLNKKRTKKKKSTSRKDVETFSPCVVSGDESIGAVGNISPINRSTGFPQVHLSDSIIKLPEQNMTMIQRLTNMVHSSNDPISSFALSETVCEAMQPDMEMYDQQLHNRYVTIANDFSVSTAFQEDNNSDSDTPAPELNGIDSDEEDASVRTQHVPEVQRKSIPMFEIAEESSLSEKTAVTLDASTSSGPDFHISLAMKQYIAPKPIRVPRTALPVSLLAVARDLAFQLQSNYESAQEELHSQILEVVAHKPVDLKSDDSSDIDDSTEEIDEKLCSSPTVFSVLKQESDSQFISQSTDEMVVNSDLNGVKVKSKFETAPNILFNFEGDLNITKEEMKFLDRSCPAAPNVSASFSALEAKFVLPFSSPTKGKPFQHWDLHDQIDISKSKEGTPVLLAIPHANASKRPQNQSLKQEIVVFSSPALPLSSSADANVSPSTVHHAFSHNIQELDFSLPEIPDIVKVRLPHSNEVGAFPSAATPSKQNRCKAAPDRLAELIISVNPPLAKQHQPLPVNHSSVADQASKSVSKVENLEIRKQYSEIGQKNALKRKQGQLESSTAARALTQADEALQRRKKLLHDATESAYDALEIMAPHLKAIFEENFDALIDRVIDVHANNHSSADHHHWHDLKLLRNSESRDKLLGGLVADSDDHIKRVFQSRQHYRAMMAKLEFSQDRTHFETDQVDSSTEKSKPSLELDRELFSKIYEPTSNPTTFTSGDREFVTGFTKPLSIAAMKTPFSNPSQKFLPAQANVSSFSSIQMSRSFNHMDANQGTAAPFYNASTSRLQSTPRDDTLVQAPQFVIVDSMKLNAAPNLHIAGSEITEPAIYGSAEAAFIKVKNSRFAVLKPTAGVCNPAFKTNVNPSPTTTLNVAGLPVVGGTGLGITIAKKLPLPKLDSPLSSGDSAPDKLFATPSTTILEKDAICNVQGLVQAKSIFKAAPLQTTSSSQKSRVPLPFSSQPLSCSRDKPAGTSLDSKVPFALNTNVHDPQVVLAPKSLSSSHILGLLDRQQTTVNDADSEVEHLISAAPNPIVSQGLSPSVSPFRSPSPVTVGSFSTAEAVADFSKFLSSFSIEGVLNKSHISNTMTKVTQSRRIPVATADAFIHNVDHAEHVVIPSIALPVSSDQSLQPGPVAASSCIPVEVQIRLPEASLVQENHSFESTTTHPIHKIESSLIFPPVSQQVVSTPGHSKVSVLVPSVVDIAPAAMVPSAHVPPDSHRIVHDAFVAFEPPASSAASASVEQTHALSLASAEQNAAEAIENLCASVESDVDPVFDAHASAAYPEGSKSLDSDASLFSVSIQNDASLGTSQTLIQPVLQVPQTTPHTSQHTSVSEHPQSSPMMAAQKPGVQGSAIRSVLLNIQGKAASNSNLDGLSPAEIVQQQRASAVELIRQRSMLNPEFRRRPSGVVATNLSASQSAAADTRRQSSPDPGEDDDEHDEEHKTGIIFKNQKIVCF
jgi:hypothetical protein